GCAGEAALEPLELVMVLRARDLPAPSLREERQARKGISETAHVLGGALHALARSVGGLDAPEQRLLRTLLGGLEQTQHEGIFRRLAGALFDAGALSEGRQRPTQVDGGLSEQARPMGSAGTRRDEIPPVGLDLWFQ